MTKPGMKMLVQNVRRRSGEGNCGAKHAVTKTLKSELEVNTFRLHGLLNTGSGA